MSNSLEMLRPIAAALRPIFSPIWFVFEGLCSITDRVLQTFGVFILIGMWGLLMFNAIARWTEWFNIQWSIEITSYMVAWSICIMMGPITRSNEQIKVTFLPEKLLGEKRGGSFLLAVENIIGLLLCLYLAYHAYDLVKQTGDYSVESSAGWRYPMWIIRSGLVIGFLFSSLYYVERNIKWIKGLFAGVEDISSSGGTAVLTGSRTEAEAGIDDQPETEISKENISNKTSDGEQE